LTELAEMVLSSEEGVGAQLPHKCVKNPNFKTNTGALSYIGFLTQTFE